MQFAYTAAVVTIKCTIYSVLEIVRSANATKTENYCGSGERLIWLKRNNQLKKESPSNYLHDYFRSQLHLTQVVCGSLLNILWVLAILKKYLYNICM